MGSWLVPPIVIPVLIVIMVVVYGLYRKRRLVRMEDEQQQPEGQKVEYRAHRSQHQQPEQSNAPTHRVGCAKTEHELVPIV